MSALCRQFVSKPPRRKSAGVFIYKKKSKKVLFVQSYGEKWGPPKGHFDENETPERCAARELKEETGIELSPSTLIPYRRTRLDRTYIFYVPVEEDFYSTPVWDKIDLEITDIRWFSLSELTGLNINTVGKKSVHKFMCQCNRDEPQDLKKVDPDIKCQDNITH